MAITGPMDTYPGLKSPTPAPAPGPAPARTIRWWFYWLLLAISFLIVAVFSYRAFIMTR